MAGSRAAGQTEAIGVRVVEYADDGSGVTRLTIVRPGSQSRSAVGWELCYGGVVIAEGSIPAGQVVAMSEITTIDASMDSTMLILRRTPPRRRSAGLDVSCIRPCRPETRAERAARTRWPALRDQEQVPTDRENLALGLHRAVDSSGDRSVVVYQDVTEILVRRTPGFSGRP